jgi:hypothetical protein
MLAGEERGKWGRRKLPFERAQELPKSTRHHIKEVFNAGPFNLETRLDVSAHKQLQGPLAMSQLFS